MSAKNRASAYIFRVPYDPPMSIGSITTTHLHQTGAFLLSAEKKSEGPTATPGN